MGIVKEIVAEIKKGLESSKTNYCRVYFAAVFGLLITAYLMTAISFTLAGWSRETVDEYMGHQSIALVLGVMLVLLLVTCYTGAKIYDRYTGSRLRMRGWNEYSYFRGLQIAFLVLTVFHILPLVVVILLFSV